MNSFFFLHTNSLMGIDYESYRAGMMSLLSLSDEMCVEEIRVKNEAVYNNPLYQELCVDYSETSGILTFIEQCKSIMRDIVNDTEFAATYPGQDAGFLGISFININGISVKRQVRDRSSLFMCRREFLERLIKEGDDNDLRYLLQRRFPWCSFSNDALKDLLWWKHNNNQTIDGIIALLDDIPSNPFTGGIGQTEVLSNTLSPVASKRINQKDRLTYTFGNNTIIHRCKDHY